MTTVGELRSFAKRRQYAAHIRFAISNRTPRGSAKYENAHLLSIQRSLAELPKTWVFLGRLAEPNPTQHFLSLNPTQPKNLVGLGWVTRLGPHAGPGSRGYAEWDGRVNVLKIDPRICQNPENLTKGQRVSPFSPFRG